MVQVCQFDILIVAASAERQTGEFYSVLRRLVYFNFLNLHGI